jgi:hypothetical protein
VKVVVSQPGVVAAVQAACAKVYTSIDRPGMFTRSLSERVDHKLQGDVATRGVLEFLQGQGLEASAYDEVRTDGFRDPDPGYDLLVSSGGPGPKLALTTSVRSSLLPAGDTVATATARRDFKVFADGAPLHTRLSDIEIQVYYARTARGLLPQVEPNEVRLAARQLGPAVDFARSLGVAARWGTIHIVRWATREALVQWSHEHGWPKWVSSKRGFTKRMWTLPLTAGAPIEQLPRWLRGAE